MVRSYAIAKILHSHRVIGIGYETALDFAKRGAKVILACRNISKAQEARRKIIEETHNHKIFVRVIDLASFESVRAFAEEINKTEDRLDILVNNAGAVGLEHKRTVDGRPLLMQVNYFSSFLLTNLLLSECFGRQDLVLRLFLQIC